MYSPQELKLFQSLPRNCRHAVFETDRRSMPTSVALSFADFNDGRDVLRDADQRLAGATARTVGVVALILIVAIWSRKNLNNFALKNNLLTI